MRRRIILLMLLLFPIISWGQSRLVKDKLARANEVKANRGICVEYIDALFLASDEAFKENEMTIALEVQKELVLSIKQVYPDNEDMIHSSEDMLATLYLMSGLYLEALPLQIKAYQRDKGINVEADLDALELLSHSTYKLERYQEAIEYRKEKINLIEKYQGKTILYAENIYLLALLFLETKDFDNALVYTQASVGLFQELNEINSDLYLRAIQTLRELDPESQINDGDEIHKQYLACLDSYFKTDDVKYIQQALNEFGEHISNDDKHRLLSILQYHQFNEKKYSEAVNSILQMPYMESADWFALGRALTNTGDFLNAKESYKYAWANSYNENNDVTDKFFDYFEYYAQSCINIGDYREAFNYLETFYASDIKIEGNEVRAALYMYVLAQLKFSIGDYAGAADCAGICAPIFYTAGIYDEYSFCLIFQMSYYEQIGDFSNCINIIEKLITTPSSSDSILMYKAMLPLFNLKVGEVERAKGLYEELITAYKSYKFSDPAIESGFLHSLGSYAQSANIMHAAEEHFIAAIKCYDRIDYQDDVNFAQRLLALANLYLNWPGSEDRALDVCENAYNIIKTSYDVNFPSYFAFSLSNLYAKYVNNLSVYENEVQRLIEEEKIQAKNLMYQMTEEERNSFWAFHDQTKDFVFCLDVSPATLYDYALFYKGILLSCTRQIGKIVGKANDAELNALYSEYIIVKQNTADVEKSNDKLRLLERQLLSRCKDLGYAINEDMTYTDLLKILDKDTYAVEFIDYKKHKTATDSLEYTKYIALIINKDWDTPRLVELCLEDDLSEAVVLQDKAYSDNTLYELIWKPLEKYIPKGAKVYYSPAGITNKVAFEAIKVSKKAILSDNYDLIRLSSTREICDYNTIENEITSSVVYGGLLYNVSSEEFIRNSQEYSQSSHNVIASDVVRGQAQRNAWRFLPGTRSEAESISRMLSNHNISCNLYVGALGNEESFKSLSRNSPSIIHVATHGFYLESNTEQSGSRGIGLGDKIVHDQSALRRSGLIMSGANAAWIDGVKVHNVDDGVLTAEEISQMDLRNTTLAVISACESGLGNITNDGIEGLVRGFKSAGVKTIVVTLWKVDDAATELMMTEFYKALVSGKSRRESFDIARGVVKANYEEPFYWAPFVMID